MMQSLLQRNGHTFQRSRVRSSLNCVDPVGTAKRWSQTVHRRTYKVHSPNSLWHIDAHMKLIRWGLSTHGCIDGMSRLVTFLECSTNNTASKVVSLFVTAARDYGLPSRVRTDHGLENYHVGVVMNLLRGENRGSFITGESIHNERIERLWRDVYRQVIHQFYNQFYALEDEGILDVENEIHKHALHLAFLPQINTRLSVFRHAWNTHKIRTENNQTPEQLWLNGMLQIHNSDNIVACELFSDNAVSNVGSLLLEKLQGLAHFQPGPSNEEQQESDYHLTNEQQTELDAVLALDNDRLRYLNCLDKLEEFRDVNDV